MAHRTLRDEIAAMTYRPLRDEIAYQQANGFRRNSIELSTLMSWLGEWSIQVSEIDKLKAENVALQAKLSDRASAIELRNAFYEAGWRTAASWAHREDLYADTTSEVYVRDRDAVLTALKEIL